MKAFLVGLLVVMLFMTFSMVAFFLLPFVFLMGFFLKSLIMLFLGVLAIWVIGKITLLIVEMAKEERIDEK